MSKCNDKLFNLREKLTLLILINIAQMAIMVIDFADFRLELEGDLKELKTLIKEYEGNDNSKLFTS